MSIELYDDEEDIIIKKHPSLHLPLPKLFLKISDYKEEGSRLVSVDEFVGQFSGLVLGNGGSWCRSNSTLARDYKCVTRKANGKLNVLWEADEKELHLIERDFGNLPKGKGNKITHIKLYGSRETARIDRSIPNHIREHFKDAKCVVCGNSSIEIDHKNGLYNYEKGRVLQIEDFQPLCMHCNQQKRQSIVRTKETSKRYKATIIPQLAVFGVDFTQGDERYDPNDPNAMVGTYWYDPVDFLQKALKSYADRKLKAVLDTFIPLLHSDISIQEMMERWKIAIASQE